MEAVLHGHDSSQPTSDTASLSGENIQIRVSGTEVKPQMVSFSHPVVTDKLEPVSKEHSVITANPSMSESGQEEKVSQDPVESAKRREVLSRRPSYRKILNELSSTEIMQQTENNEHNLNAGKKEHENGLKMSPNSDKMAQSIINNDASLYQTANETDAIHASPQNTQLTTEGLNNIVTMQNSISSIQNSIVTMQNSIGIPGIQGFTMANTLSQGQTALMSENNQGNPMWMPGSHVVVQTAGGGMQAFQIQENPTTASGNMLSQTRNLLGNNVQSPQQMAEDASRKRELRLMKNRDAAKECRRRKKEYVKCLETRVAVLEHQNKQLIDELKTLKELYVHKQVDTG